MKGGKTLRLLSFFNNWVFIANRKQGLLFSFHSWVTLKHVLVK